MRTNVTRLSYYCVDLEWDDDLGDRRAARFRAHPDGGYVIGSDQHNGGRRFQPCEGLATRGSTLLWHPSHGDLADVLLRELRKGRRAAARARSH